MDIFQQRLMGSKSKKGKPLNDTATKPQEDLHGDERIVGDSEPEPSKVFPQVQKIASSLPVDHFGTAVYVKGWRPDGPVGSDRHPILIIHDLGEHAGLYRETALTFVEHGYATYGFDLRGHGRSGRRLGHVQNFSSLVKDLLQVAAWVRRNENGKAPIILGQGIGALIAMEFTKSYGNLCKAVILSAPVLELVTQVSWPTKTFLKIMSEISPTMRLPKRMNPRFAKDWQRGKNKLSPQEKTQGLLTNQNEAELARDIFFPRLTALFANELLQATMRAKASFVEYSGQVLILCPTNDAICTYHHLKKSAALHGENNVQIHDLESCTHHVFTEGEAARQIAFKIMLPWLEKILETKGTLANG